MICRPAVKKNAGSYPPHEALEKAIELKKNYLQQASVLAAGVFGTPEQTKKYFDQVCNF